MKNTELILILALSYTVMLLIMTGVNKLRPGITLHHNLCPDNFRTLNYLHFIGTVIMLIIPFMGATLPVFLFSFPDKISPGQTMTFLFCFFAIAFFPTINGLLKRREVIIPGRLCKFFLLMDKVLPSALKALMTSRTMKKINTPEWVKSYLLKPAA